MLHLSIHSFFEYNLLNALFFYRYRHITFSSFSLYNFTSFFLILINILINNKGVMLWSVNLVKWYLFLLLQTLLYY